MSGQTGPPHIKLLLHWARRRAKAKGRPFTLTPDDISIPDSCPVLGIPLERSPIISSNNSPSIDRIDSEGGYTPGNVIVVSRRANQIKSNATPIELMRVAQFYIEREHDNRTAPRPTHPVPEG